MASSAPFLSFENSHKKTPVLKTGVGKINIGKIKIGKIKNGNTISLNGITWFQIGNTKIAAALFCGGNSKIQPGCRSHRASPPRL